MNTISQTLENKFIELIFTHLNEEMKRKQNNIIISNFTVMFIKKLQNSKFSSGLSASYKKTLFKLVSQRGCELAPRDISALQRHCKALP